MPRVALDQVAPNFSLADYCGSMVSLADFRSKKNVLLVFNRTFTWPFCRAHMAQMRQNYPQFVARDIEIVVVGPEDANAFADYFRKEFLPFIGLPDPKASVLKLYGQEVNLFKLGRMPAQVLIDKAGVARYVHYGHNMSDIPKNEELLALGDEINVSTAPAA
jgi:peroxiredoxin